jgi:regulation of enolase protein 1 (concanavalin A-like superfamily)
LTALVSAEMNSQWDAGALMVFADKENWGKIAFEKSAYQEPTIVSVVTKGISDDCYGEVWAGGSVWLRIGTVGKGLGLYYSANGVNWRMARVFSLGVDRGLRVGFEAQSPTGQGATATFQEIRYRAQGIENQFAGE